MYLFPPLNPTTLRAYLGPWRWRTIRTFACSLFARCLDGLDAQLRAIAFADVEGAVARFRTIDRSELSVGVSGEDQLGGAASAGSVVPVDSPGSAGLTRYGWCRGGTEGTHGAAGGHRFGCFTGAALAETVTLTWSVVSTPSVSAGAGDGVIAIPGQGVPVDSCRASTVVDDVVLAPSVRPAELDVELPRSPSSYPWPSVT